MPDATNKQEIKTPAYLKTNKRHYTTTKQFTMKKITFLISCLLLSIAVFAQSNKRPLTFDDILKWKRITETHIANNGKYIVYQETPWKGDPVLKISTPKAKELASIPCGSKAQITADSKFVVFTLTTPADTLRMLKLKKTKKEDLPQDKLAVFNIKENKIDTIDQLKSVKVPEKWSGWIAYQTTPGAPKTDEKAGKKSKENETFPLFIHNLNTGKTHEIPAVGSYTLAKEKPVISFVSAGDSTFKAGVYVFNLSENQPFHVLPAAGQFKQLTLNKSGEQLAFLADTTKAKEPAFALFYWQNQGLAQQIVANNNEAFPENWIISENGKLSFSDNSERLFFGTAPQKPQKDTTVLEEEIPVLDIWHWNEEQLHTEQLYNKTRDEKKSFLAVYHFSKQKAVQLESEIFTGIRTINEGNADKLLAYSNRPYAVQTMWEGSPEHLDFYLVDMYTGAAKMIKQNCRARPMASPDGQFIFWYSAADTTWNTYDIASGQSYTISSPASIQIADELNDRPNLPESYRYAGWLENDEAFWVYDRYDLWSIDPRNSRAPINLTQNGRTSGISYRLVRFNPEPGKGINPEEPLLLKAYHENSKADAYYSFDPEKPGQQTALFAGKFKLSTPRKAKDSDLIIFSKEDFKTYPNLLASNLAFKKQVQISDVAPQQKEFVWGTAELISWQSLDGKILQGTLHKPENFDPNKKYPLIVNFYERSSDRLLSYRMPENHRSTIDYHYYTSNGYVIFNPDVHYKNGYPGESAFNCVMPGINHVVEMGFIDPEKIGAQGHSWGGYQVAYLATRTNMFAAIESGAPVVNMFSAYGGIRWGSGKNRSFQYEHTQSRIGKSIWEAPLRYLENSPLFTADKIETPILIMHNDDDGAVPWYQGIEFFIALRRMGKPSWLLNYNEADHWPTKVRDMHDFQIRMAQFFDHYLKDAPMPIWMKDGIPATQKGINMGYELTE